MQQDKKNNYLFYGIAISYLALLVFILITRGTILSIFTDFPTPQRLPRAYNIIPFHSLSVQMANLRFVNQTITGNIIMFIPIGIIISCFVTKNKVKFFVSVTWSMAISILAEILQFVLATGACDVDDIITNTMGGAIGVSIYAFIFFRAKCDPVCTKSIVTLIAYIFPPFMFSYLRMQTVSMEQLHFDLPDAIVLLVYFIPIGSLVRKYFQKYFCIYISAVGFFAIFFYALFIKYV